MTNATERRRPATVTVAATLMTGAGLGYLILALALFGQAGRARAWTREMIESTQPGANGLAAIGSGATILVAMITIAFALALLGTAAAVRAGSQPGRITAWVVMGLILLCGTGGAARGGTPDFGNNVTVNSWESDGRTSVVRMSATLPDAYSPTYRIASGIFATAAILSLIVAIVLLTRPSAGRWFRPEALPAAPPALYRQGGPFAPPPSAPFAAPPPSAPFATPPPFAAPPGVPPHPAAGIAGPPAVPHSRPPSGGGPSWSRPVEGPGSTHQSRAEKKAQLAVLARRHQRGELTDAEYTTLRARLTDT